MARITVEDCLEKIDNQYDLVLLAKERTVQLNSGAPALVEEDNDKRTIISLREIGDGKISVDELEKNAVKRLRKEGLSYNDISKFLNKVGWKTSRGNKFYGTNVWTFEKRIDRVVQLIESNDSVISDFKIKCISNISF